MASNSDTSVTAAREDITPLPPAYSPIQDVAEAADASISNKPIDPTHLPFKPYVDGTSLPVLENRQAGDTAAADTEQGDTAHAKKKTRNVFIRLYRRVEKKHGFAVGLTVFLLVILLFLGVVGGVIFGFTVAAERGLTG